MSELAPKRIAIFLPSLRGGGAERAMLLFAEGLLKKNCNVDLLLSEKTGPLVKFIPDGVRCFDFNHNRVSRSLPDLIRYLKSEKPDALYATVIHANIISILASKLSRTKTPVIIRESNVPKTSGAGGFSGKVSLALLPWAYSLADGIIAVSEDVKKELLTMSPKLERKIRVLPTPVISETTGSLIKESVSENWFDGETPFILGCGRLHHQKDFPTLIKAFSELKKSQAIRLIILGEGSLRKELEDLIIKLNLKDSVKLPGFVSNPYPYFDRASAFILSSKYEGMPNALIQAMACGTPVISTDCKGGSREVLCDGRYGALVPVGDHLALSKAIKEALLLGKRKDVSDYVNEKFGLENSVRQYLSLLES